MPPSLVALLARTFVGTAVLSSGIIACGSLSLPSPSPPASPARPCVFLTHTDAVRITGDTAITNQALDVVETVSGYVACIFADPENEANSVAVQIKNVPGGVSRSALMAAVSSFALGEPVEPFQSFPVSGIGDAAVEQALPTGGVAFVVFSKGDALVYVGARSASVGTLSLRSNVEALARRVAAGL